MAFESTMWTAIGQAKGGSSEALQRILERYRPPLLDYLRGCRLSEADAEDVVQDVFLEMTKKDFLARADRTKGKFRSLLIRVTRNVLASGFRKQYTLKRGGRRKAVSLDDIAEAPAPEMERFNQLWVRNLIRLGLDRLHRESSRWKVPYPEVLSWKYLEDLSYDQIAAKLGCEPKDVDNYCYHGRQLLKRHLIELAQEYSSSPDEHSEEIELLKRFLG